MAGFALYVKSGVNLVEPGKFDSRLQAFCTEFEHEGQGENAKKRLKKMMKQFKIQAPVILKEKREMTIDEEKLPVLEEGVDVLTTVF